MYPEDSVSARPPSGVQWRLPRRACPSSLTFTGPATRGQREGLVSHALSGQRAGSGRESERFARPPSGSTGRPRTGAQNMLRPQSAKAVIRERPQSAKTYTVPVPIPRPRSAKSSDSASRPNSATRPHSASVSRRVRAAPAPDPSPSSLAPLSAWRQDPAHLSYQCTGLDDSIPCLVYLPSLAAGAEHLPPLPPPNSPRDPLEYSTIILPKQLWNPKKYKSPYTKPVTEENTCNHAAKVRLYDDAGEIIYERYEGARTQGIVRKEIVELERLMQGLSTEGSNCLVVQLQGDINSTNKMVHDTLQQASQLKAALPNDEIANANSSAEKEPESWVRFYEDHAEIMSEIRAQHRACVRELAQIEASLGPHHERLFSHALEETVTS